MYIQRSKEDAYKYYFSIDPANRFEQKWLFPDNKVDPFLKRQGRSIADLCLNGWIRSFYFLVFFCVRRSRGSVPPRDRLVSFATAYRPRQASGSGHR